jgi:hypothetical protein
VPERIRPFHPPEFLLFVNDPDLIPDAYREYLFNQFRERWPYPGLPIRLRMKGRESREVQDRKKESRSANDAAILVNIGRDSIAVEEEIVKKAPRRPVAKPTPRRRAPSHKPQKRLGGKKTAAPRKGRAPRR